MYTSENLSDVLPARDLRVLVCTPTGRDSELICGLLGKAGVLASDCPSYEDVSENIAEGSGILLIADEALKPTVIEKIGQAVSRQPTWSDFPIIVLSSSGQVTAITQRQRELRIPLGNILLVERPVRPETLISAVQGCLRGRIRQYEMRSQLQQLKLAQEGLLKTEKLAVAGRLAASVAHEINNPLEAVMNLIYLARANASEKTHSFLEMAERELNRVSHITRQTLAFYKEPAAPGKVNLSQVVQSVLPFYTNHLQTKHIELCTDLQPEVRTFIVEGEFRQIFANLLLNAIDALELQERIVLRTSCVNGYARLIVADSGRGIPPENLRKIWEPFFTTKKATGTGLGLWVTKEIIERHRGRIRVRTSTSKRNHYTVFVVDFEAAGPSGRVEEFNPAISSRLA